MTEYRLSPEGEALKAKLEKIRSLKKLLKSLERQIADEKQSISLCGQDYTQTPIMGGIKTPIQERYVIRLDELNRRYESVMNEVFELEDELSSSLDRLTPLEQSMLIDRYINGWSWRRIMDNYGYEEAQSYRLHNKALNNFAKLKDDSK